jgi:hypothetical protein
MQPDPSVITKVHNEVLVNTEIFAAEVARMVDTLAVMRALFHRVSVRAI